MKNRFFMNFRYWIAIMLFLSSCGLPHKSLIGTYQCKIPVWVQSQVTINHDTTFVYNYQSGLEETEVKGKWKIDKNGYIIFNSDKLPVTDSIKVIEQSIKYKDSIVFVVKDFENKPLGGANITFKNIPKFGINVNEKGEGTISNSFDIEQFTIHYLGYEYSYRILAKGANYFDVQVYYPIAAEAFYRYFTNEKWKMKGNKLIDLRSEKKIKYKKMPGK